MKIVLKRLRIIFLLLSIFFLLYIFSQNSSEFVEIFSTASLSVIGVSVLFWICTIFFVPLSALVILVSRNNEVSYRTLLSIYVNRIPAKYLPGGVWQTFARAYDLNALGVSKVDISVLIFYENIWSVLVAAIISTLGIFFIDPNPLYSRWAIILFLSSFLFVPFAYFFREKSFILPGTTYLKLTLVCLLFWAYASLSFLTYFLALDVKPAEYNSILLMFHYLFSFVVGFVSFFAPQGIGVFEVTMAQLSDFELTQMQALVLIAGFRVVMLVSDMLVWLCFFIINKGQFDIVAE